VGVDFCYQLADPIFQNLALFVGKPEMIAGLEELRLFGSQPLYFLILFLALAVY
jgi:hypothetical protein